MDDREKDLIALHRDESRRDFKEAFPRIFNGRSELDMVEEWKRKTKVAGDHYWRKVHMLSGEGDYLEADNGEEPKGV